MGSLNKGLGYISILYLDINYKGKRWWEPLKLTLTGDKSTDKQIIRVSRKDQSETNYGDYIGKL
ncbi:MAG: hypothetical protein ACYCVH_01790 [Ignavibacteriaceae bacterium]